MHKRMDHDWDRIAADRKQSKSSGGRSRTHNLSNSGVLMEPMKSRAPQLHLEYRFYKALGQAGLLASDCITRVARDEVTAVLVQSSGVCEGTVQAFCDPVPRCSTTPVPNPDSVQS
ncbi:Casein kinase I isoform gamma-2 [Branchiostoma belcheri]|nr:Casein kinase I isoform gamma-2 [Branchiostoma belcheri]